MDIVLDHLAKDGIPSLQLLWREYENGVKKDNKTDKITEWYTKQHSTLQCKILENMLSCFISKDVEPNEANYDKRFIVLKTRNNLSFYLEPISPICRKVLFASYKHLVKDSMLEKFFNSLSLVNTNKSVQGVLLERHLINLMILERLKKFKIVSFDQNKKRKEPEFTLMLNNFCTINFAGSKAPIEHEKTNQNTLYIPISPQYPAFDFVYCNMSANKAFFVNVTLQKNAYEHINKNDKNADDNKMIKDTIAVG